uniref:Uncharacterized protein n=1 Tax=Micrurus spixii TaxID=129469 RepID=A0A2D4M068_9SAUR
MGCNSTNNISTSTDASEKGISFVPVSSLHIEELGKLFRMWHNQVPRNHFWSPMSISFMRNTVQGYIKTLFIIQAMPANRTNFTVCTDQELYISNILGETNIFKRKHVFD